MANINFLSLKGGVIGIFLALMLILAIPLLFLLSQQTSMLSPQKTPNPTPTPIRMMFEDGSLTIAGYVYHDDNHDGERKAEEKPEKNVTIQIKQLTEGQEDTTQLEAKTDTYGYFSFRVPVDEINSYMIKLVLPRGYKTVTSNPIILSELKPNTQNIVEFGLIPSGEFIPSPTRKPTATPNPATPTP